MPKRTGPFPPLWSEDGYEAAHKEREKRKKAGNQQRHDQPLESGPEGPASDYAKEVPDSPHPSSLQKRIESWLSHGDPWRLWIGFAVLFLLLVEACDHGLVPGSQALATEAAVTEFRAQYMQDQILEAKRASCLITSRQERAVYVKRMSKLQTLYREVMGRYPDVVTCKEMGLIEMVVSEP